MDHRNRNLNLVMQRTLNALDNIIKACLICFVVFSMFSISLTQISFGLGSLAWLVKVQLTRSWKEIHLPLGIPMLLFVAACLLAVALAVDPGHSFKSLKKLLQIIVFYWAVNSIRDSKQRNLLVILLIVSACGAAANGFVQFLRVELTESTRVEGTMSTYMTFGGILMLTGLLGLGRLLFRRPLEYWLAAAVVLIGVCLLLTLTRQAWLGFFVGAVFLGGFWKPRFLFAVPILIGLLLLFSPPAVKTRLHSMVDLNNWTFQARVSLWRGGWAVFKDHPVTGCGFRCMDIVLSDYPDPTGYIKRYKGMHNNFVQLAVDTGILGLSAWMSIWVAYFLALFRRHFPKEAADPLKWVPLGSGAAVLGFLAGGFFEVNFYDSEVVMLLYFIMALPFVGPMKNALPKET